MQRSDEKGIVNNIKNPRSQEVYSGHENYETTNIKNPGSQDVCTNHENWHPRIKVLSRYTCIWNEIMRLPVLHFYMKFIINDAVRQAAHKKTRKYKFYAHVLNVNIKFQPQIKLSK
jgi:hypothetical protein